MRSTDVATRDTELHLTVEGDSASTRWQTWMLGPGGVVQLAGGDALLLDGRPLSPSGPGGHAITTAPGVDRARLVYARPGDAEDVTITVELPPLTPIELPASVMPGELAVRWAPSPGPWATTVRVEGPCLVAAEARLLPHEDDGVVTLAIDGVAGEGCTAEVRLLRIVARHLEAAPLARAPSRIVRATRATVAVTP